jgi:hypothetical protein
MTAVIACAWLGIAMWLAKPIYEALPHIYLGLGAALVAAAFYLDRWYWPEVLSVCGLASLVVGLILLLKRRGYRHSRSRVDFDETL